MFISSLKTKCIEVLELYCMLSLKVQIKFLIGNNYPIIQVDSSCGIEELGGKNSRAESSEYRST